MAKQRKVHPGRLAIVILVPVLLIAALGGGIWLWNEHKIQTERKEEVLAKRQEWDQENERIAVLLPHGDMEIETLASLKSQAMACRADNPWQAIDTDQKISQEQIDAASQNTMDASCSQAQYFIDNIDQYTGEMMKYYLDNPERYEFVKAYPQRADLQTPPAALEESLETVPMLLQWDTRWGYEPYGDSTVFYAGCAPTCLSMVFSYLKQDPSLTPAKIKSFSEENGYYVSGVGTAHSLLSDAALEYGVNVTGVPIDEASIKQALDEGKVLVFNMVPGTFTRVGHFIVVYGEQDGKLMVRDPNNIGRTEKLWSYDEVLPETAAIWAYSV